MPGPTTEEPPVAPPSADDYVDRAREEPRDEAWAAPTERLFEEDLRVKAQRLGFRVGVVGCHTESCVAELFWDSLRDARQDFKETLGGPERTGCRPRLLLTEGGSDDAPEMGRLVLHCMAQRQRAARQAGLVVDEGNEEP
jgi:hypothetical protein